MNIAIVLIVYNPSSEFFKNNLNISGAQYIVVDNSTRIETDFKNRIVNYANVDYISNQDNLGIATALNIGVSRAQKFGFEFVITMDQDSHLSQKIINDMMDFYRSYDNKEEIIVVSPNHVLQDGVPANHNDSNIKSIDSIYTMTSGNLLSIRAWESVGRFRDDLFIDMVDVEFYARAKSLGYKTITLVGTYMCHNVGNMEKKEILGRVIGVMNHNYIRKYYQIRNTLYVIKSYRANIPEIIHTKRGNVTDNILAVIFFESDKFRKLRYMLKGYIHYKCNKLGKLD